MSDLASHMDYDDDGRPVLVVYRKWQSALWTPGRQALACRIPLNDIWQIEGCTDSDVKRLNLDPDKKLNIGKFGKKVEWMLQMFNIPLGKKPNVKIAQTVIWLMDQAADVFAAENVKPEVKPKKEVGSIDVIIDGNLKRTDPLLV